MSLRLSPSEVLFRQRFLAAQGYYAGKLDGAWGPKTEAADTAFEVQSEEIAGELGTFDQRSEGNLLSLVIPAQIALRGLLRAANDYLRQKGGIARATSGTRTYAEQDALWWQGRTRNGVRRDGQEVVTNARGGESNHNFALAIDISIYVDGHYLKESPLYGAVGHAVTPGLADVEWGGAWQSFKDAPHYQLRTGLSVHEVRERFERGEKYW